MKNILKKFSPAIPYYLLTGIFLLYMSIFCIGEILPNTYLVGIILLIISIFSAGLYFFAGKKIFLISMLVSGVLQFGFIFLDDAHNDIYRYLWDGYASAQQENVYELTPWNTYEKNFPTGGNAEIQTLWEKTGFKHYYTTYPPTLQLTLWAAAEIFPLSQSGIKFFFWLFNLGSIFLLWKIFTKKNLPGLQDLKNLQSTGRGDKTEKEQKNSLTGRDKSTPLQKFFPLIILSPIFIWEAGAAAHSESIFIFFLLLSIFLFQKKFFFWSSVALAALIWTKFFPIILVPIFLAKFFREKNFSPLSKNIKNFLQFSSGGILATVFLWLPFIPFDPKNFFEALDLYSSSWDMFPLFFGIFTEIFSREMAQILQLLAVIIVISISVWKNFELKKSLALVLLTYLLFAPAIFSWYFLWVLPLLPFLLVEKKIFFLWSLFFIPPLQYFFTVWQEDGKLFWYANNGLLPSQQIIFWGLMGIFLVVQILLRKKPTRS